MGGFFSYEEEERRRREEERRRREEEEERRRREEERRRREEEERRRREEEVARARVKNNIRGLQNEMEVHSRAHNLCAEYYRNWKTILFVLLLIVGGLSAGYKALGWKTPQPDNPKTTLAFIGVIALGVATFVFQQCYNAVDDSHKKHYKAEKNYQSIADRAGSVCDSSESASSLRNRFDGLLKDKGNSSEIPYEQWAYKKASKK